VHGSANAPSGPGGESVREPRQIRESVSGVAAPDITGDKTGAGRRRASDAARRRRLVVPSALLEPERAEQTIASLNRSKYSLREIFLSAEDNESEKWVGVRNDVLRDL
jgi:hypothetical protein